MYNSAVRLVPESPLILLANMDTTTEAFRQVSIEISEAPVFGYTFDDDVVIDRCLQFAWTSSPSVWGLCAGAV